ncbi:MAG: hypothetical protein H6879_07930 [Rhodobiaceae bacterium]|nr:hypothetical protein [Rhodobiaceae bacterium]
MQPKTAIATIVIAFFMATVVMGLGRAMISERASADSGHLAMADAMPALVLSVQY